MTAAGLALASASGTAAEPDIGIVSAAGSDVFISRNGKLIPVEGHAHLFAGDQVLTRAEGKARIAMNDGCVADLAAMSMASVRAAGCGSITSLRPVRTASRPSAGAQNFVGAGPSLLIQIAMIAIANGAFAAERHDPYPRSP